MSGKFSDCPTGCDRHNLAFLLHYIFKFKNMQLAINLKPAETIRQNVDIREKLDII